MSRLRVATIRPQVLSAIHAQVLGRGTLGLASQAALLVAFMGCRTRIGVALTALGTLAMACSVAAPIEAPTPQELAPGVWMIAGGVRADREPDGNSVIFDAPAGLVVVDTGRHRSHRDAIRSFARIKQAAIIAIVNSHWHLDHVSGNPDLRVAFPDARVYASDAIDGALGGFLASSARASVAYLEDPSLPAELREDIRVDIQTIKHGEALKPDVVLRASGRLSLGGRVLQLNMVATAATAGDVWVYDEATRVAALGDLVTLPAPFLDTACPEGWRAALAQVAETPFLKAVPGHGAPMTQVQFGLYRRAFEAFLNCSASVAPKEECSTRGRTRSIHCWRRIRSNDGAPARPPPITWRCSGRMAGAASTAKLRSPHRPRLATEGEFGPAAKHSPSLSPPAGADISSWREADIST